MKGAQESLLSEVAQQNSIFTHPFESWQTKVDEKSVAPSPAYAPRRKLRSDPLARCAQQIKMDFSSEILMVMSQLIILVIKRLRDMRKGHAKLSAALMYSPFVTRSRKTP